MFTQLRANVTLYLTCTVTSNNTYLLSLIFPGALQVSRRPIGDIYLYKSVRHSLIPLIQKTLIFKGVCIKFSDFSDSLL